MISLAEVDRIIEDGPATDAQEWLDWYFLVEDAVKELDLEMAKWWAELEYAKL